MSPRANMARTVSRKHTAVMHSPSSYFKQKVTRAARSVVTQLRRASIALGAFIVWLFGLVKYMNVIPSLVRFLKPVHQLRKKEYDATDSATYVSGLRDRILQFLSTESTSKKRLLKWVKACAPSLHHVTNLSSQWCDGVTLCVLINEVVPGTCPRHDLLQKEHAWQRVNNCRLAIRLVQRNLGIREPMTPDEMANPGRISESKMLQYLISMKNASYIPIQEPQTSIKLPEAGAPIESSIEKECSASGSGLVVAVVDKRARFNITTQDYKYKNLYVAITGPNMEKVRRKIAATKVNRQCLFNAGSSQSSKDEQHPDAEGHPEPIPLDYQVIKAGAYQVNYIPRSLGIYHVAITWGGEHIKNSPFKVRSTTAKNIEQTTVRANVVVKAVSFQDEHSLEADNADFSVQSDNEGPSTRFRRQSLVRQSHISTLRDSYESTSTSPFSSMCSSMVSSMDHNNDTTSDVFLPNHYGYSSVNHPFLSRHNSSVSTGSSRSGSILSRSSSIMHSTDRSSAVKTRRKVIRRIIKGAGGTEEVTYPNVRSSSILSSSQMSSMASSPSLSTSMSIDDRSPKFSTSSSSSVVSGSFYRSPGVKVIDPREKYADQMSTTLLGQAYHELTQQIADNMMATRPGGPEEDRRDNHRRLVRKPPAGTGPNNSKGNPSSFINSSQVEDSQQRQTHPTADGIHHSSLSGSTSQTDILHRMEQSNTQVNATQPAEQTRHSADLDEYLKYKHDFLRGLGNEIQHGDLKQNTPTNNGDELVGVSGRTPRQAAGNARPTDTSGHVRRTHKKRKEDKATQCTAQDIKIATGWISRRNTHRNAQLNINGKNDNNCDSALGESDGSVTFGDKDNSRAKPNRNRSRVAVLPGMALSHGTPQVDSDQGSNNGSAPVLHRRSRSGTQSSSQGRQSTFDSGFSDENGQAGQESRRNGEDIRGRVSAPLTKGRQENVQSSSVSVPDTRSTLEDNDQGDTATTSTTGDGHTNSDPTTAKEDVYISRNVPIEIVPPSPVTKPSGDRFKIESTNQETLPDLHVKSSSDNETDREDVVLGQYLNVDIPYFDSSTVPTPGDSSVGNISSPDADILASAECKSNMSSDVPDEKSSSAHCDTLADDAPASDTQVDVDKINELSLDAMLLTLDNDPEYSTREFLRKYQPMMEDELGILAELPSIVPDENEPRCQLKKTDASSYHDNGTLSKDDSVTSPSQPLPERCHASGVGLYHGIVGDKNNFQVRTMSAGDGSLSITVRGPRPHTVNETNVVYTGDDLYEVIYDVSLAGFYVISVKWADKHVPNSPFIVKVIF